MLVDRDGGDLAQLADHDVRDTAIRRRCRVGPESRATVDQAAGVLDDGPLEVRAPEVQAQVAGRADRRVTALGGDPRVGGRDDHDDRAEQDLADRLREARAPTAAR